MRILLVEDNPRLSDAISASLSGAGYEIDAMPEAGDALAVLAQQTYDALVLDLGLPDMDGMEVLKSLRAKKIAVPVLILTARDSLSDKINGLNSGADDYLVKPFETEELVARVRALLRRPSSSIGAVITINNVSFDTLHRQTAIDGKTVDMSRRETDLLEQLLRSTDKIVTKKNIETRLYSYDERGSAGSIDVLVHRLRKKLVEHGARIDIHTLRGIGYMIAGRNEETTAP